MITENVQIFWSELQRGEFISDAAVAAGTYRKQGTRWVIANGGVRPRRGRGLKGRCLSFAERELLALLRAAGMSMRAIATQLGRSPSTISRELRRNTEVGGGYLASSAHAMAYHRASRPKPAKLAVNLALRARSRRIWRSDTHQSGSPAGYASSTPTTRRCGCPQRQIYLSVFQPVRKALRRGLHTHLRSGRTMRLPKVARQPSGRGRIKDMVLLADRPAEVEGRLVPGHWEGDLVMGRRPSAVATLVERTSRYVRLVALPDGIKAEPVKEALVADMADVPPQLRRTLTWDRGREMAQHSAFTTQTCC